MSEQWKPVAEYEGLYEISNQGRVRSLDRAEAQGNRIKGRVLIAEVRPSGHLRVTLCKNSTTRRVWVHRLVLSAYVGPMPEGTEACHNDGNPANNTPANLRWDTKSANARDRRRHGTDARARKTHCPVGHAYTKANTYLSNGGQWRRCKKCTLDGQHARTKRLRAEREAARGRI